jgi:2-furoyl-CoA dehydrogenase 2Fe-2S iron sulfur subunit
LSALQAAFKRHHALQCGFCTAGILMSCADWLERLQQRGHKPSEQAVREMLSGHLCRCTGYTPIVQAVMEVAHA